MRVGREENVGDIVKANKFCNRRSPRMVQMLEDIMSWRAQTLHMRMQNVNEPGMGKPLRNMQSMLMTKGVKGHPCEILKLFYKGTSANQPLAIQSCTELCRPTDPKERFPVMQSSTELYISV